MANYYWLGITGASGNVNNPANWTLWSPQGACGFLPPAAATGPGYGDSVYFARFTVSGACYGVNYYPQIAPQGPMLGRTGAAQHFANLGYADDCPVPLGAANSYFKFNVGNMNFNVGPNNGEMANTTSYIHIGKDSNQALYPNLGINTGRPHTLWIKGQARNIATLNVSRSSYATIHLKDLEFAVPIPTSIVTFETSSLSNDKFYVYSTTTGYNGFKISGQAQMEIEPGYSQSLDTILYGELSNANAGQPTLSFAAPGYSGASGANEFTRTYINKLRMTGGGKNNNLVYFNHGVDVITLECNAGTINFNQTADSNATVVQKGYMYGATSKLYALNPTVAIGSNGDFTIFDSQFSSYTPDITLKGNWIMDLNPGPIGVCGPD